MAEVKEVIEKIEWESFLGKHPEANFLQSFAWGQFHKNLGKKVSLLGFYKDGTLVGVMLSIVEPARRGRYLTVPGGPIIDWNNKALVAFFVEEIKKIGKENKCVFVRVRPQLESDEVSRSMFKSLGFRSAPVHLHAELTSQLGLNVSEEELLGKMRKNTRYEVRKAQSLGIKIETTTDEKKIKDFYDLQISTSQRKGFVPFSYKFLLEQFKVFAAEGNALLYSAFHGKTKLAQAFIIFYGQEAVYHYGASTPEGRKYPGAYLIQWEAIMEAKRREMTRYNLWGVAPEENKNHRFYNLSVFKRGFGGQEVEYLHAQDLIIDKPRYLLNLAVEIVRKKIRRA